jgi:hypothetical protein
MLQHQFTSVQMFTAEIILEWYGTVRICSRTKQQIRIRVQANECDVPYSSKITNKTNLWPGKSSAPINQGIGPSPSSKNETNKTMAVRATISQTGPERNMSPSLRINAAVTRTIEPIMPKALPRRSVLEDGRNKR